MRFEMIKVCVNTFEVVEVYKQAFFLLCNEAATENTHVIHHKISTENQF